MMKCSVVCRARERNAVSIRPALAPCAVTAAARAAAPIAILARIRAPSQIEDKPHIRTRPIRSRTMLNWLRSLDPRLPRDVWLLQVGGVMNSFGNGVVLPFLVIYLHRVRGFGLGTAGLVVATS